MKYPKFLTTNKNVLFIAPSFGCTTEPYNSRLKKSFENFIKWGLNPTYGPNAFSSAGVRSNTIKMCVKEFMEGYTSDNQLLLSVGGGNLMNELLDYIDFNKIKDLEPKWFMGYSDNTNLTFTLNTLCDVATIYSSCASEFGTDDIHESQLDSIRLIKGEKLLFKGYDKYEIKPIKSNENPYLGYNLTEKKVLMPINYKDAFSGRLIGGCIDCLTYLIGTQFDKVDEYLEKYKNDGFIWFLEACDLTAPNLRLAILQMKRRGWFKYVKGFLFGRSYLMNDEFFSLDMHNAITEVLEDLGVPVILDCDFGHLKPQLPIISGAVAKVVIDNNIEIEYILK